MWCIGWGLGRRDGRPKERDGKVQECVCKNPCVCTTSGLTHSAIGCRGDQTFDQVGGDGRMCVHYILEKMERRNGYAAGRTEGSEGRFDGGWTGLEKGETGD